MQPRNFKRPSFFGGHKKNQLLSSARREQNPVRDIANYADYKGLYEQLKIEKKFRSPLHGAAFSYTALQNFYELSLKEEKPSANNKLVTSLFYLQGQQFRPTQNKSLPAYSLSPAMVAKILHHLNMDTLSQPEVKKDLITEWCKTHIEIGGGTVTTNKLNALLDHIVAAKKECQAKIYGEQMTETILLSFVHHKCTTREQIIQFLQALDKLEPIFNHDAKLSVNNRFDSVDISLGKRFLTEIEHDRQFNSHLFSAFILENTLEKILLTLMLQNFDLPQVIQSQYGYKDDDLRPNCTETAFHNLCNILLFNEKTNEFDFSLLPQILNPAEGLVDFYKLQNFKTDQVNFRSVGQAFMDLLSGKNFLYRRFVYELKSDTKNFLPVMQFLFGVEAANLGELSKVFSDERRKIDFEPFGDYIKIKITQNEVTEELIFAFDGGHAELRAERFYRMNIDNNLPNLSAMARNAVKKFPQLLPVLYRGAPLYKVSFKPKNLAELNYFIMHFYPKKEQDVSYFISALLPHLEEHKYVLKHILDLAKQYGCKVLNTPLIFAVKNNKLDLAKELHAAGGNLHLTVNDETLLHLAHSAEMVLFLLSAGIDPNVGDKNYSTPLHQVKSVEVANILLAKGANPNLKNDSRMTPLHFVSSKEIAEALIAAGAKVNVRDNLSATPLHYVKEVDIAKVLVDAGADPNALDYQGYTVLHLIKDEELFRFYLSVGCNPNAQNHQGMTPLFFAESVNTAQLLINAGGNILLKDEHGRTPLMYLKRLGMENSELGRFYKKLETEIGTQPHVKRMGL